MDSTASKVERISLKEFGLHLLVFENVELLEVAILLHLQELVERGIAHAAVVLLFQNKELSQVRGALRVGCSSFAISHTQIPDLVHIILLEVQWVPVRWHFSGGSDDVTEIDIGVGELSAQETVHVGIVAADLEVAPEHLNRVVVAGINRVQGLLGCHNDINYNVCVVEAQVLALVHN